ncbi:MAG: helix-turn-helix domain-containing protein [Thermoguttaceae bacterium]|nr:helix-turn-helix domain-containing protein [Thermoguttaceae bacterium]
MGSLKLNRNYQPKPTPDYMNLAEAASYCRVCFRTLKKAIAEGRLPCRQMNEKTYRISRKALDRWLGCEE